MSPQRGARAAWILGVCLTLALALFFSRCFWKSL